MNIPKEYAGATTLEEKIVYLLTIMEKGAAPELAMEIAEMDGIASEEGMADLTISIEKELEKMCDEGIVEIIKEHRQRRRYGLVGKGKGTSKLPRA